jgi:hypothetical protein
VAALARNHERQLHDRHQAIWFGWIEEMPGVNCQEATRDELIETLKVTLREALELNQNL